MEKRELPILEYDGVQEAIINPWRKPGNLPRLGLLIFFEEVLNQFVEEYGGMPLETFHSEMKDFIAYVFTVKGVLVCAMQAMVGSAAIAMQIDWL